MIDKSPSEKQMVKHLIIRLMLLIFPAIFILLLLALLNSDYALFFLFAAYLSPIVGFVFLIIETFVLHSKSKTDLRKINIILICVFLPIYILVLINHP